MNDMVTIEIPLAVASEFRLWLRQSLEIAGNAPVESGFANLEYAHVEDVCDFINNSVEEHDGMMPVQAEDSYEGL